MALEIVDYDLVGSTRLDLLVRRRPVFVADPSLPVPKDAQGRPTVAVDDKGVATKVVSPEGPLVALALTEAEIGTPAWGAVKAAFDTFTAEALSVAEAFYATVQTSDKGLDDKIAAAEKAKHDVASAQAELDVLNAKIAAAKEVVP